MGARRSSSFASRIDAVSRTSTWPVRRTASPTGASRRSPCCRPSPEAWPAPGATRMRAWCTAAELGGWVITCTAFGPGGPCVYLASTSDFVTLDRHSVVMPPEDKNAAVFPHRIDGHWCLLHRPVVMASGSAEIWLSRSEDLESWRSPERVMTCRPGGWWDHARIGIGPPPVETPEGWLLMYHGVRQTMSGALYRVGVALLDLHDPVRLRGTGRQLVPEPHDGLRAHQAMSRTSCSRVGAWWSTGYCVCTTALPTRASVWQRPRSQICWTCCSTRSHPRAREPHRRAEGLTGHVAISPSSVSVLAPPSGRRRRTGVAVS